MITLAHGAFLAREVRRRCKDSSCPPVVSDELRHLVRPGQRYGYDLVVHVGLGRYLAGRQREEIRRTLLENHGIELSAGTISALCDRFLALLESLHVQRAPQLRAAMQGGYPLHIDATSEHNKGGLFVCLDGWRQWVLWAGRVPSESADNLAPHVAKTVELFGEPIAVMRDMGEGGAGSVERLRQKGIPDLICHYHFLGAIGNKLFDGPYDAIRRLLRSTGTRRDMRVLLRDLQAYGLSRAADGRFGAGRVREDLQALVLWVLEGDGSKGALFPFALPHQEFVRRCRRASDQCDEWVPCPRTRPERRAIRHLTSLVAKLERSPHLSPLVRELDVRWREFSELRGVLRLSDAELPRGDSRYQQQQLPALEQIKRAVESYQAELQERIPAKDRDNKRPSSASGIIVKYLEKHRSQLFGHPARFDADGEIIAVVDRTNNVLETFFGHEKRRLRRRLGRAHLGSDMAQQPAQVAVGSHAIPPRVSQDGPPRISSTGPAFSR